MSLPAVQKIVEHDNCLHTAGHKNWRRSGRLEPVSQRKKSHFLVEAKSSGNLKGEQRVHGAAQLIGLMMDDTLMTTTCDPALARSLSLRLLWLCVTAAAPHYKGKVTRFVFRAKRRHSAALLCLYERLCRAFLPFLRWREDAYQLLHPSYNPEGLKTLKPHWKS